jgi:hypothetical protein
MFSETDCKMEIKIRRTDSYATAWYIDVIHHEHNHQASWGPRAHSIHCRIRPNDKFIASEMAKAGSKPQEVMNFMRQYHPRLLYNHKDYTMRIGECGVDI